MNSLLPPMTSTTNLAIASASGLTMSVVFVGQHVLGVLITLFLSQKNLPKVTAPGKLIYIDDGSAFDVVIEP